jgi:hypothetical protein
VSDKAAIVLEFGRRRFLVHIVWAQSLGLK